MNPIAIQRALAALLLWGAAGAWAGDGTVYRCPGPPVLYTDQITAAQAQERGCRTIEGAPITIVSPPKARPGAARATEAKVDAGAQRSRDSDARRILEDELKRAQAKLTDLQKQFNNGAPEREGGEKNYQKYLDRIEEMKAAIERAQSDVDALTRELAKLPAAKE